ncbi:hypothetical protein [Kitasatospora sp. GP82]|uniref:hypothetical protein n=1 Tax=Kitasatospora sp. GP82 TaxID=3035089 RepID=UPI002476A43B|nr:hypothetical protein [Kitasatospora sp. GP82]MDH6127549.1 hypothetical protein [Kitasatospora sp. GP82]
MSAPDNVPSTDVPSDTPAVDMPQAEPEPERPAVGSTRRPSRGVSSALATVGLLAVTAAGAAVTVAVGRPQARPGAVAVRPTPSGPTAESAHPTVRPSASPTVVPSPIRSAGASPSASRSASAGAAPTPTPAPAPAPAPSSTLHGTVDGSTHGGDIRYFLLPMPPGAESYGSADGAELSVKEVSAEYSNSDEIPVVLDSYGYQDDGVIRRYRTVDGKQEVEARLLRFKSSAMAREFARSESFDNSESFDIDGDDDAQGYALKPPQEARTGKLVGVGHVGDIQYEVTVFERGTPDRSLLADAVKRQRERLADGG